MTFGSRSAICQLVPTVPYGASDPAVVDEPFVRSSNGFRRGAIATRQSNDPARRGGDVFSSWIQPNGAAYSMLVDLSSKGDVGRRHAGMAHTAFLAGVRANATASNILARINSLPFDDADKDAGTTFASAFIVCVYGDGTRFHYASAGHDFAMLFSGPDHRHLHRTGPVVGVFPSERYSDIELQGARGDLLVVATDGVTEARHVLELDRFFGSAGLVQAYNHERRTERPCSAENLCRRVDAFCSGVYNDDATLLVVEL